MNFPKWKSFTGSGPIRFDPFTDNNAKEHDNLLVELRKALKVEFNLSDNELKFMAYINPNGGIVCDPTGRIHDSSGTSVSFEEFVRRFDEMMKKLETGLSEPIQSQGSQASDDLLGRYHWTFKKDGTLESQAVSTMDREDAPIRTALEKRLETYRVNAEIPERTFYKGKDIKLQFVQSGSIYEGARVVATGLTIDIVKKGLGINPAIER